MRKSLSPLFLLLLLLLSIHPASAASSTTPTAIGWVGDSTGLSGVKRGASDIWTARASWSDLQYVGYPYANADFTAFVAANPNAVSDFGTGLIPFDQDPSTWNALLNKVIAGSEDAIFVQQGQNMAKYGTQNVICRPWWEFNNNAAPIQPALFIAAWNHAVPIIKSSFAAAAKPGQTLKIAFCYLPNTTDPTPYYPGDDNVDVIDADIYASVYGATTPSVATLLTQANANLNQLASFAAQHNKPMGISEWGNFAVQTQGITCNQGAGDVPQYINAMITFAEAHQVLYMIYFNISADGVNQTLINTPLSLAAFIADIAAEPPATTGAAAGTTTTFSTFAAWQANYFTPTQLADPSISGPTADPYGSGVPNLLAYAMQLDPTTALPTDVPMPTVSNGHLTMTYLVPSAITDINYVPEVSSDLQTWSSGSNVVQVVSSVVGATGTTITVNDALPSSAQKHFMRLCATLKN